MTELYAPKEFWKLTEEERSQFGCGPGKGLGDWLVPDTIFGLDVQPACAIHDFMYKFAEPAIEAKRIADRSFLNNMVRLVLAETKSKFLRRLRLHRAKVYYYMVDVYGGAAFWGGKNKPEELGRV